MYIFSFSPLSEKLMIYGFFAVICHATAILFMARLQCTLPACILFHRFFPMLEHSLMSFIALLVGVLGIEYINKKEK